MSAIIVGKVKPKHFIAPAIALVAVAIYLGKQRAEMNLLSAETSVLRERIADTRKHGSEENPAARLRPNKPGADKSPIDWKAIVEEFKESKQGGDQRKMMSLQRRLMGMDAAELVAALDEIAALDLDDEARLKLEGIVIGPLSEKDPELVLERFKDRLSGESGWMSWQLSDALGNWAKQDLGAATAWFDRELSAGTFNGKSLDGKNANVEQFESRLIARMLGSDPALAAARLSGMSPATRMEVLRGNGLRNIPEGDQAAYADLVRGQLDENGRLDVLGGLAANLSRQGDFGKVDEYLSRISATAEEREQSAVKAATGFLQSKGWSGSLGSEDIDKMREWAVKDAPGAVDRLTGEGIANATNSGRGMPFTEAAKLAQRYRDSSGNDDVLTGFLWQTNLRDNKDEARELAGKISDPKKRDELLERFK